MTREELKVHCKRQIEQCETWAKTMGEEPKGKVYEEHKLILELLGQEPKTGHWIPVSERLPKTAGVYRVTRRYPNNIMNPNYIVDACYFDGSNTWYNDNRINHERGYAYNIIAWQENPEPYKPQESEANNAEID